ncbi:hypothetical protein V9L05_18750 [Bernardetia sp. Wsw4-3y2]|uniref:hypothetical protein n=1 Tax=Bernardetia sp. Wsw4-3y2 TaxID=3127471 RepID=UPI0030D26E4F
MAKQDRLYRYTLKHFVLGEKTATYDPANWENASVDIVRSKEYHGVFYERSERLGFVGVFQEFIHEVLAKFGLEAELKIIVEAIDEYGNWQSFFEGKVNLARGEWKKLVINVPTPFGDVGRFLTYEAPCEDNGLATLLNRREKDKFELTKTKSLDNRDLSDLQPFTLPLHSREIIIGSLFYAFTSVFQNSTSLAVDSYSAINPFEIAYDENEGLQPITSTTDTDPLALDYVFVAPRAGKYRFKFTGELEITYTSELGIGTYSVLFVRTDFDSPPNAIFTNIDSVNLQDLYAEPEQSATITKQINFEVEFYLIEGEPIWLVDSLSWTPFSMPIDTPIFSIGANNGINNITVEITQVSTFPASQAKAFMIYEALNKTLENAVSIKRVLLSKFFGRTDSQPRSYPKKGQGSWLALTSGLWIRDFKEGKNATVSFEDMWRSLNAVFNIGMGVERISDEDYFVVEEVEYFYQDKVWKEFKNIKDIDIEVADDLRYNGYSYGFEKYENEAFNSLDEFLTKHSRSNDNKTTSNMYSKVSKYIMSGYAIEVTRRKQFEKTATTSSEYDDDNFLISLSDKEVHTIVGVDLDGGNNYLIITGGFVNLTYSNVIIENSGFLNGSYQVIEFIQENDLYKIELNYTLPVDSSTQINSDSRILMFVKFIPEKNENFSLLENVLSPSTIYNARYSPTRNFLRHTNLLTGESVNATTPYWTVKANDTQVMQFREGEGNYELNSQLSSGLGDDILTNPVIEKLEPQIGIRTYAKKPLFLPYRIKFTAPISLLEYLDLRKRGSDNTPNKYKKIGVAVDETNFVYGFIESVKMKRNRDKMEADFILLMTEAPAAPVPPEESLIYKMGMANNLRAGTFNEGSLYVNDINDIPNFVMEVGHTIEVQYFRTSWFTDVRTVNQVQNGGQGIFVSSPWSGITLSNTIGVPLHGRFRNITLNGPYVEFGQQSPNQYP